MTFWCVNQRGEGQYIYLKKDLSFYVTKKPGIFPAIVYLKLAFTDLSMSTIVNPTTHQQE